MNEFKNGIANDVYRGMEGLNQSSLKEADISFEHMIEARNRVDDGKLNIGAAIHDAVLLHSTFKDNYLVKVLKKDNSVEYAKQKNLDPGVKLITSLDYKHCLEVASSVKNHELASGLLLSGDNESSGFAVDPELNIPLKIRCDSINHETRTIGDLKTEGRGMTTHEREANVFRMKYHWQAFFYKYVTKIITGHDYKFINVYVERNPPYQVRHISEMDDASLQLAEKQLMPLIIEYAKRLKDKNWSDSAKEVSKQALPTYAYDI